MPIDFSPFRETGRLFYEGPWVAERLVAGGEILARDPGALLPVIRDILSEARALDAVSAFRGFYQLEALRRAAAATWDLIDVLVVPTAPTIYSIEQISRRAEAQQLSARRLHQLRQPARSRRARRTGEPSPRRSTERHHAHRAARIRRATGVTGRRVPPLLRSALGPYRRDVRRALQRRGGRRSPERPSAQSSAARCRRERCFDHVELRRSIASTHCRPPRRPNPG